MNENFVQNLTLAIQNNRVFETSIDPELIKLPALRPLSTRDIRSRPS